MPAAGGHAAFAPVDEVEDEVVRRLRRRYGRVSIERLISGPGLVALKGALAEIDGRRADADDPAEITRRALEQPNSDCGAALARFCAMLGSGDHGRAGRGLCRRRNRATHPAVPEGQPVP